jgi:hypothetical protein
MHSPASNQMVFCDGCNDGWHQMCHEPWIEQAVIRYPDRPWFCSTCQAKRDRHFASSSAKKPKIAGAGGATSAITVTGSVVGEARRPSRLESWASRTPQQKRAYLSTLSQQELVGLLMSTLEVHPDLAIFPTLDIDPRSNASVSITKTTTITMNGGVQLSSGKTEVNDGPSDGQILETMTKKRPDDMEDSDPLDPPWPKAGNGLYSRLPPEDADAERLVDDDDFEAISVIVYDETGRKIEENGVKI